MAEAGTTISNSTASQDSGNRYNVCERSGWKCRPGSLVRDGQTGAMVLPEFAEPRHDLDRVRARPEHQTGSTRPEQTDNFLADGEVTADSL